MNTYLSKKNRALLGELVRTDFKLRYQGSILGYAWSLLKPLLLFCILYVVFVYFLRIGRDIEHFPVYLLLGIVLWNFFTEMTSQSLTSIVGRGDLIRKIRIPRWMIVFASSISATINLGLSLIIVGIFMIINGVHVDIGILWIFPSLFLLYIFGLGCSFFLAAAYVRFRDLSYIWEVILQAGFYATPIIYPLQMINNEIIEKLLLLNPIAFVIQDARSTTVTQDTLTTFGMWSGSVLAFVPIIATILVFIGGILYFKRHARSFAEDI